MNFIRNIFSTTYNSTKSTAQLGRWSIQYDPNIIQRKVNQANEDHCGCCQESIHPPQSHEKQQQQSQQHVNDDSDYEPYVFY
jgi:hypothetical protein